MLKLGNPKRKLKSLILIFGVSFTLYAILSHAPVNGFRKTSSFAQHSEPLRRKLLFSDNNTSVLISAKYREQHNNTIIAKIHPVVHLLSNTKHPITIYNNAYIIQNKDICKGVRTPFYLVIVHTATINFERRKFLRKTWANVTIHQAYAMRLVFLIGKPLEDSHQMLINKENECFGDIVQGNFVDSYRNLTHKAVLGLRWVTEHCRQAKFIVKVDDDVFVNVFKLVNEVLLPNANESRTIFGEVRSDDAIHRKGKWKVEEKEFDNMRYWPFPFCPGYFIILTGDIIPELYEEAKHAPFLWLDDVYVSGLLASKVGNIQHRTLTNITEMLDKTLVCFQSTGIQCPLLAANAPSGFVMHIFWNILLEQRKERANLSIRNVTFVANTTCYS